MFVFCRVRSLFPIRFVSSKFAAFLLKILIASPFCLMFFLCVSCAKKSTPLDLANLSNGMAAREIAESTHSWYALSVSGFEKTDLPKNAPPVPEKPWTESIRISAAGCESDKLDNKIPLGYALVNRLGVLTFRGGNIEFHTDRSLFSENTASNLFFEDNAPLFSVFKSVFFNEKAAKQSIKDSTDLSGLPPRPFIVHYAPDSGIFFPLINYEDLQLEAGAQITDFTWNGERFLCSVKKTENEKNIFSYVKIKTEAPLLSVSPGTVKTALFIEDSSADEFRNSKEIKDLSTAPARLRKLVSSIPENIPFTVECSYAGGSYSSSFASLKGKDYAGSLLEAKALIADTWALAVFTDGTSYFSGACYSRPVLADGKTAAFRLPKLPEGFIYSYFALSGTRLYVSWEETSFYKTGRSGFISVDLDAVLYKKLRRSD
ncbi:hypothetical protein [Treponema parvum]|nr:hypothetical protein [Treponema parvum]